MFTENESKTASVHPTLSVPLNVNGPNNSMKDRDVRPVEHPHPHPQTQLWAPARRQVPSAGTGARVSPLPTPFALEATAAKLIIR